MRRERGGGLCFALCLYLRQQGLPLPGSIVAISPWTDLTFSGESFETNKECDVSLSREQLGFYAQCYSDATENPLVSPLLGDLKKFPPSLIFVGGDEILRSDSEMLHSKLLKQGNVSQLSVHPGRWHAYLLYGLNEDREDWVTMNAFLSKYLSRERKLRWMRLDNAAKIYPAALRQSWSNVFRLSVTLTEKIDVAVLQSALDVTVRRFPSMCVRLRRGLFWYYFQQRERAPAVREENSYPVTRMSRREIRTCAFRVIAYEKRIAVEFFHAVTDGNGGMVFLKSLTAEYLQQKYGIAVPATEGVLGRLEEPREEELEDSFLKYAGNVNASRREPNAWHPWGTPESDGFLNLTCFRMETKAVLEKAHAYDVSLTAFLCAALMMALQDMQAEQVPSLRARKPIRVQIPVNLRRLFPSSTLRNFALYTTPEIDPRLGEYSFSEICQAVKHRMGLDVNPKIMSSRIAVNVSSEKMAVVRIMPLFLKNAVMKAVFDAVGEKKILPVLLESGTGSSAGRNAALCAAFRFHPECPGNGPPELQRVVLWRSFVYQFYPRYPGAGPGGPFLPSSAGYGPGPGGPDQQQTVRCGKCIVSIAASSWRTVKRGARCAGRCPIIRILCGRRGRPSIRRTGTPGRRPTARRCWGPLPSWF